MANVKVWGMVLLLGFTGLAQATGLGNVTEAAGVSDVVLADAGTGSTVTVLAIMKWGRSPIVLMGLLFSE